MGGMKTESQVPRDTVIVTAALTGVLGTRMQCPYIPYTAREIADEAVRAHSEGASIVHIHGREDDGGASWRPELFKEIADLTRSRCPVILNFSTGGIGGTIQDRSRHVPLVKPEIAAVNMGSMNYSLYSARQKKFLMRGVFMNPFEDIEFLLGLAAQNGVIPELECFDAGHICNADPFIDMGLLKPPFHFSLVMGVTGGISATEQNLRNQVGLLPEGAQWQLIGISREQWPLIDLRSNSAVISAWAWRTISTCRAVRWRNPTRSSSRSPSRRCAQGDRRSPPSMRPAP